MVKFLKQNKAVILLQGRYAGKKAVIIRSFDDGNRERPYGHCLVAGLKKYPSKVIRKDSAKKTAKKSRVKCFIKVVNYQHLMPTRYTLDVDLKEVATLDALSSKDKKVAALKEAKAKLEERFKTGKNRWFFTKLSFASLLLSLTQLGASGRWIKALVGFTKSDKSKKDDKLVKVKIATKDG
ncbi:60S ribosomal protein L27-3 [Raphanus sativus]|nr:60S ribosomal protein L27-3 [Raphanus sativus]